MSTRTQTLLWLGQRASAAVLALCVLIHLCTLVYAVRGGLSAPSANWKRQAQDSISRATDFLPDALRPQALHAAPQAGPRFNLYSTSFQKGPLDDHGSFEYLFKLVCATIEYELWPLESRQAEAAPPAAPQGAAAAPRLPR